MRPIRFLSKVDVSGYSQWQWQKDSASDVPFNPKDQVHSAVGKIGFL